MSNVANFELTEINDVFKCLGGVDKLKVRTLRGGGYLENVRKRTRGGGFFKECTYACVIFTKQVFTMHPK